jgi:hypothetical protein
MKKVFLMSTVFLFFIGSAHAERACMFNIELIDIKKTGNVEYSTNFEYSTTTMLKNKDDLLLTQSIVVVDNDKGIKVQYGENEKICEFDFKDGVQSCIKDDHNVTLKLKVCHDSFL